MLETFKGGKVNLIFSLFAFAAEQLFALRVKI